jgi:C4-dicarboxylate transporter, DctM subunit
LKRFIKIIDTAAGYLAAIGGFLAGLILVAMVLIIVYEIVARRFFSAPTIWSIELVTYLMLWFGFLTLAVCQRQGRHIHVDLFVSRFSPRTAVIWKFIPLVFTLVFLVILFLTAWGNFWHSFVTGERTPTVWEPLVWPMKLALPTGLALFLLQLAVDFIKNVQTLATGSYREGATTYPREIRRWWDNPWVIIALLAVLMAASGWLLVSLPLVGLICVLLVMLLAGVPIFVALGLLGMAGLFLHFGGALALTQVPNIMYGSMGNFTLAALPLFILAGFILQGSGAGDELYDVFAKFVGALPGGLGLATILSCAFFAAISISSVATAATIGMIALPSLLKRKYPDTFAFGLVGSGGTLGIMIPPSATMILYAAVTEESLGKLLIAGLLPGILLVTLFGIYTVFYCWRTGAYEREQTTSWKERWRSLGKAIWVILTPVIIIIGLFSGVFTVLECGAVASIYTLVMVLVRRKITFRNVPRILTDCGINAGFILIIIAGALTMGRFITLLRMPQLAMTAISDLHLSPGMVILAIMVMLVILGMFLEVASVMMITLPVLYPIVTGLGYDGVWFAVLMTLNMEMALITPPVGLNLYVIQGIASTQLAPIVRGVAPFFVIMVLAMIILYFFPQISLWLPNVVIR